MKSKNKQHVKKRKVYSPPIIKVCKLVLERDVLLVGSGHLPNSVHLSGPTEGNLQPKSLQQTPASHFEELRTSYQSPREKCTLNDTQPLL